MGVICAIPAAKITSIIFAGNENIVKSFPTFLATDQTIFNGQNSNDAAKERLPRF
jgi:hypothetical protein